MTSRWQAVLFDRDDTLCTTDPGVYTQAGHWAAERFGLDPKDTARRMIAHWQAEAPHWHAIRTPDEEAAYWAAYARGLAGQLGLTHAEGEAFLSEYPYEAFLTPVPDAAEVLRGVRVRGLRVGVLSNTFPSIDRTLRRTGLADLVDVPLATCTLGVHKPDPRAFTLAAEALGLPPAAILFLDDLPENVDAARRVGMAAERVNVHHAEPGVVHDLRDVLTLIDRNLAVAREVAAC